MKTLAIIITAFSFSGCATVSLDTDYGTFKASSDGTHIALGYSK